MVRIPTPIQDLVLLLSPRWAHLSAPLQILLLGLVFALPLFLLVCLYRYEMRLIRRSMALALLGLRLAVISLLLTLVFLQPILARTSTEQLPGQVLVALDHSASMTLKDGRRQPLDKLKLARLLGLHRDLVPGSQLDGWIRQYEEKGAPDWSDTSEQKRLHDQLLERVDPLTRLQIGQRLLAKDGMDLLTAISARHRVHVAGFAADAWEIKPEDIGTSTIPNADMQQRTDIRLPLTRGLETSGPEGSRILGVVLLTDGQHNTEDSPVPKALELGERKLPILAVPLGPREAPSDIALAAVKAPPTVFKDVDANVEARYKISGLPAQDIVVTLQPPGQPVLEKTIHHDGKDRYHTVRFQVRMNQPGTQTLTLQARPVDGEITTDNNGQPVVIQVADDKARVLLVDSEARWEYHYLASALLRDRAVQTQSVLFHQPRLNLIAEEELRKLGNPLLTLPTEADAYTGFECIVLGDVSSSQLSLAERTRLEKYVADSGGTLVIVAGKRAMPLEFTGPDDPLARLLPIEEPRLIDSPEGFRVALSPEGRLTPFMQLEDTAEASAFRWAALPPHYWGVVGKPKPGAVILATPTPVTPAARKRDGAADAGLIVRQNYGFGRVLYVGLDSTWRWRFKVGDVYHHRFWGQGIRWAAADKALVAGNEQIRFGTREPVYRIGQEVELLVRLGEEVPPLRPDALAGLRVVRQLGDGKDEAVALVPLTRRDAQPRVLEGRLRDLPPGSYAVELAIPELADRIRDAIGSEGKPDRFRATFTVAMPESTEMVELAVNLPLLTELATKSGGQVIPVEEAARIVEYLDQQSVPLEHRSENKLWQWWGTLVLFLGLLTAEWVLRKWAGLP